MAKTRRTIEEKINRLEAIKYLIDTAEQRVRYLEEDAKEYYERCLDEDGNVTDESCWEYRQYLEQKDKAEAMTSILEEIEDLGC